MARNEERQAGVPDAEEVTRRLRKLSEESRHADLPSGIDLSSEGVSERLASLSAASALCFALARTLAQDDPIGRS